MSSEKMKEVFYETMIEIADQIRENAAYVNRNDIVYLIDLILQARNNNTRVFVYGAGRSGFVGRCFAQRLMHLGIESCFVSDAVTYQYSEKNLLILVSGTGETPSTLAIAQKARKA